MKTIRDTEFPAPLTLWTHSPRQIESEDIAPLKHDADIMRLRYAAMELCSSAFLVYEDCTLTRDEIEDHASVCSNALYLNDFEGYRLTASLDLRYLYMNTEGRMCAAVYDSAADDCTYWCIY